MGRQAPIQYNFTAGELSPRLIARGDTQKYRNGAKTVKNFKTLPHGGAAKRAGTKFIAEVKDSTKQARVLPFVFATDQAYQMVFGEKSIRAAVSHAILADDEYVPDSTFTNGMDLWTPATTGSATVTWNLSGFVRLDSGGTGGDDAIMTYVGSLPLISLDLNVIANNFSNANSHLTVEVYEDINGTLIDSDSTTASGTVSITFTPTSERTRIVLTLTNDTGNTTCDIDTVSVANTTQTEWEIGSPYDDADLSKIKIAQSADTIYLVHPDYPPHKLVRYGDTEWNCLPVVFVNGPYLDDNLDTASTITPSATTGNGITLVATKPIFRLGHVGSYWKITHGATTGYVKIASYTDQQHVYANVIETLGGTTATDEWAEGAWSGYRGYPAAIGFYEQRLWFGRTAYRPATFWGSVSGDYENMTAGVNDDEAVIYELTESQVNDINWLSPSKFMLAGTTDVEHRIGQEDTPISPTNVIARPQTAHGSADYQPVQIGEVTIFVQRARRKLRELSYSFDNAAYIAPDLTILAEHITRPGVTELVYQQEPDSIVWALRDDGKLCAMTYERSQDVIGWHWHETDGSFESLCVTPTADGDELTCIVNRTIGGATKRYIEYFEREFEDGDAQEDAFYVDCGIVYSGVATATITGLGHLEGKAVNIFADGAIHPVKTVSSGQITLDYEVTKAAVGLAYAAKLETLPPAVNNAMGSAVSRPKRWAQVATRLYNSLGLKVNGVPLDFRSTEDLMDAGVPFFSGWAQVPKLGTDVDQVLTYDHDYPTPCTILSQTGTLDVADE